MEAGAWDDVLREHAAPPRRSAVAATWWSVAFWVVGIGAMLVAGNWFLALVYAALATANTVTTVNRRRRRAADLSQTTSVSGDGLLVHGLDRDRYLAWDQVLEVYPRAAWAPWPTVRCPDGSTVALPGVPDDVVARLDRFRAHLAAGG